MKGKNPVVGLFWAWLIPGGGHYYIGIKDKGLYYFALVNITFFLGLILAGFCSVNIERYPWHYIGEIFYGGATLAVQGLTVNLKIGTFNRFLDYGTLMTTIAGLLNVVVMVDFFETWARRK